MIEINSEQQIVELEALVHVCCVLTYRKTFPRIDEKLLHRKLCYLLKLVVMFYRVGVPNILETEQFLPIIAKAQT